MSHIDKKIGATIKELRTQNNITQLELAEESPIGYICSVKQLQRYESGKATVHPRCLAQFLSVFRIDSAEFYAMVYDTDLRQFENDFELIWDLGFAGKFEEFKVELKKVKSNERYNKEIPIIAQKLLLCDSVLASNLDKNYATSLQLLYDALRVTQPSLLSTDNKIAFDNARENMLSFTEYRILRQVANTQAKHGCVQESIQTEHAVIALLEREETYIHIKKRLLPVSYFNLSNKMLDEKMDGVLDIIERGLRFCTKHIELKLFGELLWNKGNAYHLIGDTPQSEKFFKQSIAFFIGQDNLSIVEYLRNLGKSKYGIDL